MSPWLGTLGSHPQSKQPAILRSTVGETIDSFDTIEMMCDDEVADSLAFTQAIIFHLGKSDSAIGCNAWLEVFLSACVASDARKSIRDTERIGTGDWQVPCCGQKGVSQAQLAIPTSSNAVGRRHDVTRLEVRRRHGC